MTFEDQKGAATAVLDLGGKPHLQWPPLFSEEQPRLAFFLSLPYIGRNPIISEIPNKE
jgi:hypothetical protein